MLVLRVRCVDDGRELLLERNGADAHSVQVAELKELVLRQRQHLSHPGGVTSPLEPEDCFVLFRGQILADPDVVDLNALSPTDFFVFAVDAPQSGVSSSSSGEKKEDAASLQVLQSQLVEMGFSAELAAQALRQSGNNLLDAAALLTEGKLKEIPGDRRARPREDRPSIAPLRGLMHDKRIRELRALAATDSFQALSLLKELSSVTLNQMNEHPVATLRLLSLPAASMPVDVKLGSEETIDVDDGEWSGEEDSAIDRVRKPALPRVSIVCANVDLACWLCREAARCDGV
jgi:hypothetical protein